MDRIQALLDKNEVEKKNSIWKFALRALISLVLLVAVYSAVDLHSLLQTLGKVQLHTALALVALYTLGQLISAGKWRIFLNCVGVHPQFGDIVRSYFFGMFVNTFGVGTVGGDVVRCLVLRPSKGQRVATLATAVADRVHGLAVLLSIGALGIIFVRPKVAGNLWLLVAIASLAGIIVCWLFGPKLLTVIFPKDHKHGKSALGVLNAFPRSPRPFLLSTAISIFFHSLQIFMHYIIARELGAQLPLAYLFATVPFVNIASSLPISIINGLGIREAMYIVLFVPYGITEETAVAFGAIWILTVTLVSALGGLLIPPRWEKTSSGEQKNESSSSNLPTSLLTASPNK